MNQSIQAIQMIIVETSSEAMYQSKK